MRLLKADAVRVHPFTENVAYRIGLLLGASQTADVAGAHVAMLGRTLRATVITSDPTDLLRLDPSLSVVVM